MRAEEIIKLLEEQFPPSLAMDWEMCIRDRGTAEGGRDFLRKTKPVRTSGF